MHSRLYGFDIRSPIGSSAVLCALCTLSLFVYLAIRSIGSPGLRPDLGTVEEESAIFGRLYDEPEVRDMMPGQRIQLYGYTVLTNLVGNFAMLFSGVAVRRLGRPEPWIVVFALSMVTTIAMRMSGGDLFPAARVGVGPRLARCATLAVGWLMACLATGALSTELGCTRRCPTPTSFPNTTHIKAISAIRERLTHWRKRSGSASDST